MIREPHDIYTRVYVAGGSLYCMKNSFGFSIQYKELDAQLAESKFAASGTARAQRGMRAFRVCLYGVPEELDAQLAESER